STTVMVSVLLRVRSTVLERLSRKEDVIVQVTERPWDRMFRGERPHGCPLEPGPASASRQNGHRCPDQHDKPLPRPPAHITRAPRGADGSLTAPLGGQPRRSRVAGSSRLTAPARAGGCVPERWSVMASGGQRPATA